MSTLSIRSLHLPHVAFRPALSRFYSGVVTVLDVFTEAQEMARAAHKRYPFVEG